MCDLLMWQTWQLLHFKSSILTAWWTKTAEIHFEAWIFWGGVGIETIFPFVLPEVNPGGPVQNAISGSNH